MAAGGGQGWVAAAFSRLMPAEPDVPLHIRLISAQCATNPTEPELAAEARVSAIGLAQRAVPLLQAGDLKTAAACLEGALRDTQVAMSVYDESRKR